MKNKKIAALVLLLSSAFVLLFPIGTHASNGKGMELSVTENGAEVRSFCDHFPLLCTVIVNGGGNGSGNEPPIEED